MELNIENISPEQIEVAIRENPTVLLPISTLEPFGKKNPLCIEKVVVEEIASTLSTKLKILKLPTFVFAPATSFRAFSGTFGSTDSTFHSFIRNIIGEATFFGIKRVIIINGSYDISDSLSVALKKIRKWKKKNISILNLNWQREPAVLKFITKKIGKKNFGRQETAMLSMYEAISNQNIFLPDSSGNENSFQIWSKRNRDPEQFGKLFPEALKEKNIVTDPPSGRKILEFIENYFEKTIISDTKYLVSKERFQDA